MHIECVRNLTANHIINHHNTNADISRWNNYRVEGYHVGHVFATHVMFTLDYKLPSGVNRFRATLNIYIPFFCPFLCDDESSGMNSVRTRTMSLVVSASYLASQQCLPETHDGIEISVSPLFPIGTVAKIPSGHDLSYNRSGYAVATYDRNQNKTIAAVVVLGVCRVIISHVSRSQLMWRDPSSGCVRFPTQSDSARKYTFLKPNQPVYVYVFLCSMVFGCNLLVINLTDCAENIKTRHS